MSDSSSPRLSAWTCFWLLSLAALVVRAGVLFGFGWPEAGKEPFWDVKGIAHGSELGTIARNLAEGRGFSSPFEPGTSPSAWFAPLVPYLWALVFQLQGVFSDESFWTVMGLQIVASALACGLYAWIAHRIASRREHWPAWTVWIAGGVLCVWPEAILQLRRPWYFPYQELGIAALIVSALSWRSLPSTMRSVRLGVVAALVLLINPVPLLFLAWIFVWLWWRHRGLKAIRQLGLAAGIAALLIAPWLVRNFAVFERPAFIRTNFGVELWQGNNPEATPKQSRTAHHPALDPAERAEYERLGEVDFAAKRGHQAVQFMLENPSLTALRTAQRIYIFWCSDLFRHWPFDPANEWQVNAGMSLFIDLVQSACILVPLAVFLTLLCCGTYRNIRDRWIFFALFLLLPIPYYLTHVYGLYGYAVRPYVVLLAVLGLIEQGTCKHSARAERVVEPVPENDLSRDQEFV